MGATHTRMTTADATSAEPYRARVRAIFAHYDPGKVGHADAILAKYPGEEEQVITALVAKYGPEPKPGRDTQVGRNSCVPAVSYRQRVEALYKQYDPAKIGQTDAMLAKYKGKEEAVIRALVKKYGPEPSLEVPPASSVLDDDTYRDQDTGSHRARLEAFFGKYDPTKIANIGTILITYKGRENELFATLVAKYGPEPGTETDTKSPSASAAAPPSHAAAAAPGSWKGRFEAFFRRYDTNQVPKIDHILAKYKGNEAALMIVLVTQYGPEPGFNDDQSSGGGGDFRAGRTVEGWAEKMSNGVFGNKWQRRWLVISPDDGVAWYENQPPPSFVVSARPKSTQLGTRVAVVDRMVAPHRMPHPPDPRFSHLCVIFADPHRKVFLRWASAADRDAAQTALAHLAARRS